ncbi:ribonuclease HI [Secundilactobacillus pentosiphilus]|uniref:Ribonuclease H n=1 Tax=Secundilactobacillus pentosiphilus TaxID=1714682 RepID=A0A1Z5IT23_9LACO|nr:ribonuclease H family protein [Secundilactobacillus pentosiphilus]GAX04742.1 ribonuclease HI [Secundilactobacillus pentosiphilus]
MMGKYYAVRKGQHPGIYTSWPEAQKEVSGYSGAEFKGFNTEEEAKEFMGGPKPVVSNNHDMIIGYTDGGTRNSGNVKGGHVKASDPAAWAYRLELPHEVLSDSAGEWGATNNRMEIMAFIKALEELIAQNQQKSDITLVLDSKYVLDAINKGWLKGWQKRGWRRSGGELMNAELWQKVSQLLPQFPKLSLVWTKGHADNQGNIFVDTLLNKTMDAMVKSGRPVRTEAATEHQPADAKTVKPTQPAKTTDKPEPKQQKKVDQSVSDIQKALGQLDLFKNP